MLDISFIISCVWLQSINRGFTPHSCIIYNTIYPFHNPTSSRSIPRNSTGYEPGFAHSFSNTFILQLQLHLQRFSWFPRLPFAPRVLRSIFSFKRKLPCFNSFLSITVDKSCRHRMHLHSKIPRFQVHSLFPISVDEIASLLPCFLAPLLPCHREKKPYVHTRSYYHIWHSNLCTTSGAEWELITLSKPHKSGISEAISPSWKAWWYFKIRIQSPLLRQPYITWLQIWWYLNLETLHKERNRHQNLPYSIAE